MTEEPEPTHPLDYEQLMSLALGRALQMASRFILEKDRTGQWILTVPDDDIYVINDTHELTHKLADLKEG